MDRAEWQRRKRRLVAYGRWVDPFVPTTDAVAHIETIRDRYDISNKALGVAMGFDRNYLDSLIIPTHYRYRSRIRRETEARILGWSFDLDAIPPEHLISRVGTGRRIRALVAIGWPMRDIAKRLGIGAGFSQVQRYARLRPGARVTVDVARRVRDLYDELSMTPGPSEESRKRAAAAGWPPPLAWDDDQIDRIDGIPNVDNGSRRSVADTVEDIEFLLDAGPHTPQNVADRLGCTVGGIVRACHRAERPDLLVRMRRNRGIEVAS